MNPVYKKWAVSGYQRAVMDQEPRSDKWRDTGEVELVVVVGEPGGTLWEVTAENGRLTSLGIRGDISVRSLAHSPVTYLEDIAVRYLAVVEAAWEAGSSVEEALREADLERGHIRQSDESPDLETFAAAWRTTPQRKRRERLAERFGVSVFTVDKWIRLARATPSSEGTPLIPKATTGRGNRKVTTSQNVTDATPATVHTNEGRTK